MNEIRDTALYKKSRNQPNPEEFQVLTDVSHLSKNWSYLASLEGSSILGLFLCASVID